MIGSLEDGRGKGVGVIWRDGRCQVLSPWIESGRGAVASPWAVWAQVGVRMPVWAASTEYLHFANSGNEERGPEEWVNGREVNGKKRDKKGTGFSDLRKGWRGAGGREGGRGGRVHKEMMAGGGIK